MLSRQIFMQVEEEKAEGRETEEYQKVSAQKKYEDERASKKKNDVAMQMVAEKRGLAKQEGENVSAPSRYHRSCAAGPRTVEVLRIRFGHSRPRY
jgi:hypothetical protein